MSSRYGHACTTAMIEEFEAAHPVPDAAGLAAAGRLRVFVLEARGLRQGTEPAGMAARGADLVVAAQRMWRGGAGRPEEARSRTSAVGRAHAA